LKYDVKKAGMAALFLSTKTEETPKKMRDICNVFWRIHLRESNLPLAPLDIQKEEYWKLKEDVMQTERYFLKELGFIVHTAHPHKFILNFLKILNQTSSKELAQRAWNYLNDGLRTNICLRFPPPVIATAAIYMAARDLAVPLPEEPKPWWELLIQLQKTLMKFVDPFINYIAYQKHNILHCKNLNQLHQK